MSGNESVLKASPLPGIRLGPAAGVVWLMIYSSRMQILRHVLPFLSEDVGETRILARKFFFRRLVIAKGRSLFKGLWSVWRMLVLFQFFTDLLHQTISFSNSDAYGCDSNY